MSSTITEAQLHAYADGLLPPQEREQVRRWLEENPEAAARVADWQQLNDELAAAYPLPDDDWEPDLSLPARQRPWLQAAVLVLAMLAGAAGGWLARDSLSQTPRQAGRETPEASLVSAARVSHLVYTPEVVHPVEVSREQQPHLVNWLSKRMGKRIKAPDLSAQGFTLMGGRLLPSESGPAAQFMYENGSGQRLTLYVKRDERRKMTAFHRYSADGISSFYWIDNGLGYVLSGPLSPEALQESANEVYRQLSL